MIFFLTSDIYYSIKLILNSKCGIIRTALNIHYRDVNVADENSLIALSTCSEAETNGRVVLIGKLEREVAEKQ